MKGQGIWSGTISFSLVAIPVRLVGAVAPERLSFQLLHGADYSPLSRRMFCPDHGAVVGPEEIVRGFELAPGRYLPITEEELRSVSPDRSHTIEIIDFIDMDEVDPVYLDHPYYLLPLKGGEKAYRLLAEVMRQTNKAGFAKFVLSEREHLAAVTSRGGALALYTLHYASEVVSAVDLAPQDTELNGELRSRIEESVKKMLGGFNPAKYADERREKLLKLIRRKAEESPPVEAPEVEEEEEGPPDLMAALERAMAEMGKDR